MVNNGVDFWGSVVGAGDILEIFVLIHDLNPVVEVAVTILTDGCKVAINRHLVWRSISPIRRNRPLRRGV